MGLKQVIKPLIPAAYFSMRDDLRARRELKDSLRPIRERTCPICEYRGIFGLFGRPPRLDAMCKGCGSLERHRLLWLWFRENRDRLAEPVLHFAPEPVLRDRFKQIYADYRTADLVNPADLKLDIEAIALPDASINTIICNHVLEHVCDRKALAELHRILAPGGKLICSVPIIEGWDQTYENPAISSMEDREVHFGQSDHVRYYGRDFRDRLAAAGFATFDEITASGEEVVEHGLLPGEKIFVCTKI